MQSTRTATVVVPKSMRLPEIIEPPDLPGDLPEPHTAFGTHHASWRSHDRAHHRISVSMASYRPEEYEERQVKIVKTKRDFRPFTTQINNIGGRVVIVNHFNPQKKVDRDMNKRRRDWKDPHRETDDDSRSTAFSSIPYRVPRLGKALQGALKTDKIGVIADTFIAVQAAIRERHWR